MSLGRGSSGALALLVFAGCAGEVEALVRFTPAAEAPAPVAAADGDGDGIVGAADACPAEKEDGAGPRAADGCPAKDEDGDGVAGDACPDQAETKNGYRDEDGCPDELPDFYLAEHVVHYTGELKFGLLGGLQKSSDPVIAGIAAVLAEHGEVELVEIGVHLGGSGSDLDEKSQTRANDILSALRKAGIAETRLRAVGYGARCPKGGARIDIKVVKQGGEDTGVVLCPN